MVKIAQRPAPKAPAKTAATAAKAPAKAAPKAPVKSTKPAHVEEDDTQQGFTDEADAHADPDPSVDLPAEEGDDEIINMSEVDTKGGDFELLPRGRYPVAVDESTFSLAKKSGNLMTTLRLEVTEGDYANRKLWHRLVLTKENLGRVKRELEVLGMQMPEDGSTWGQIKEWFRALADSGELIGQTALANVKQSSYEGEMRNEVRSLIPADALNDVT